MNRYFLYLVFLNMLTNVIIFIPKILIEDRYNGAVSGILIAIPIGLILTFFYSRALNKFPEQGITDIPKRSRVWLKNIYLGFIQILWFSAGLITLVGFIDIISRFINPDIPKLLLLLIYLTAVFFIILLPTDRVMYFLEIVLILCVPLIGFIILKAVTTKFLSWDSILEVGTYILIRPTLKSIAAATYVFTGYTNLIIFNRLIKEKLKLRNYLFVLFLGIVNLMTTFFIPIGIHGSDGAQELLYPWISTSDSLRLPYGPIERVIFIFLMLYMVISLMSISIHWHISLELVKGIFKKRVPKLFNWSILSAYTIISIVGVIYLNTLLLNRLTVYWLIIRFFSEITVVLVFCFWAKRRTADV